LRLHTAKTDIFITLAWFDLQPMAGKLMQTPSWHARGDDAAYGEMLADYLNSLKQAAFAASYQRDSLISPPHSPTCA
jgi:hypothetical protein